MPTVYLSRLSVPSQSDPPFIFKTTCQSHCHETVPKASVEVYVCVSPSSSPQFPSVYVQQSYDTMKILENNILPSLHLQNRISDIHETLHVASE